MQENRIRTSSEYGERLYKTWFFVLLLIQGYGIQFDIGKELKIADQFHDFVLKYKNVNTKKDHYIFCQVKLVEDGNNKVIDKEVLLGKKNFSFHIDDFNIKKYFTSYLRIREQFLRSNNFLSKLVIFSNVSGLHDNLKKTKDPENKYDQILSANKKVKRCFIDFNSIEGKKIAQELKWVHTDWDQLVNILFKYTDKEYASKNPMTNEQDNVLTYYHKALVNENILTVSKAIETTDSILKSYKYCGFHENFQNGILNTSGKHLFDALLEKSKLNVDNFKACLKDKKWKVWEKFGEEQNNNNNKTLIANLPSIQSPTDADVSDFLNILEFNVGELNLDQLSLTIRHEFEISNFFQSMDADYICNTTENYIKEWNRKNQQADDGWIIHKDKFFLDFKRHISKIDPQKLSYDHIKYYKNIISRYDIHFNNKITNFVGNPEKIHQTIIIFSDEVFLTTLKVIDSLNEVSDQYLYFEADDILIMQPHGWKIQSLIKENANKTTIVLNWQRQCGAVKQLKEIIDFQHNIQLIVITNNPTITFENCLRVKDEEIQIDNIKNTEKLLEMVIDCQGERLPLKALLPNNKNFPLKEIISPKILKTLILGKSIFFNFTDTNETNETYIPRKFLPRVFDEDLFKCSQSMQNELFIITGVIDETKKNQWLTDYPGKLEIFKDNNNIDQKLQSTRSENKSKNIHWLEHKSNTFIWKCTFGAVSFLITAKGIEERTLLKFSNHLHIITGAAGLGKSTTLNFIKTLYIQEHPCSFVVLIKLNEQQETLNKLRDPSVEEPEDFVCELLTEENAFYKELIKYGIKNQNGTLLLFDGYDEIQSEKSRNLFRKHLSRLNEMKNVNIVITSRPIVINELETELNVLSTTLQPFTEENQKSFLEERIAHNISSKTIEEKSQYLTKILELVGKMINNKGYSLVGIPLILKMISEIFINNCADLEIDELPKEFDLIKLYQYFIEAMYRRYFEEKESTNMEFVERILPNGYQTYYYYHQVLSISSILHKQIYNVNYVFPEIEKQNQTDIQNNVRNKGIVTHINGDEIKFIHQTFAEYFFTTFIFSNCTKINCNPKQIEFFFNKVLCDEYFQNVRSFLNSLFSGETNTLNYFNKHKQYLKSSSKIQFTIVEVFFHIIYNSVLENNDNIFKIVIVFYNDESLQVCQFTNSEHDFLYQEMLFAAVKNNNIDITMWLLENVIKNVEAELKRTVLHVASEYGSYDVLKCLIKDNFNINEQYELGFTLLHLAARNGHIEVVKLLTENNVDVNACNSDNWRPLYVAAQNGQFWVVKFLTENHADVNACTTDGWTSLHAAVQNGHVEVAKFLTEKNADVNAGNKNNITPLHLASQNSHFRVMKLLIENNANVNVCDKDDWTPLHMAVQKGRFEIVKFLAENHADVNSCTNNKWTSLHIASENGHLNIVKLLIENGANVNAYDEKHCTPLMIASYVGHIMVVVLLIEKGANVNDSDINNWTPIHAASRNGHLEVVKVLIENKADVNACNKDDWRPLHIAARKGHLKIVEFLIKNKAEVNVNNKDKCTPLYVATQNGHIQVVQFLTGHGADVNVSNKDKRTLLHVAAYNGHIEVVKFLREINADAVNAQDRNKFTPLHLASYNGHIEVVKFLTENGADVNASNEDDWTPLHIAAQNKQDKVAQILIKNNANVNARDIDKCTPLYVAAYNGGIEVVKILKEHDGDVNACNQNNCTPLHVAVENGHLNVVKFLTVNNCNVNAKDIENCTPLFVAALNGHFEIVKYLIEHNADPNVCDIKNRTPLHIAKQNNHIETVQYLEHINPKQMATC